MSKFWNRTNAYNVPDSKIRTNTTTPDNRNNRYRCQICCMQNSLRDVLDVPILAVVQFVPVRQAVWRDALLKIFRVLPIRNVQFAGQHDRAEGNLDVFFRLGMPPSVYD
jgi:hypothetical protein